MTHRHAEPGTQDYPEAQKQLAAVGCPEPLLYYCSIVIFGVACNEERVATPVNLKVLVINPTGKTAILVQACAEPNGREMSPQIRCW